MSVQTVQTIVYNQLRALLETEGGVFVQTVRPGNRIWMMGDKLDPEKMNHAVADYPESVLDYGDFTYAPGGSRYGQQVAAPIGTVKTLVQNFVLTITHADMRAKINDPLNLSVLDLLEARGRGLGVAKAVLPHVERGEIRCSGPAYGSSNADRGDTAIYRARFTFTWPVTICWKGEPAPTQTV